MNKILDLQKIENETLTQREKGGRGLSTLLSFLGGSTISNHC
ncbi:class III lanthipeptide [Staphylococcus pseudintermedius]|nr:MULTISPECIES: class III lanthipeptide [Staphylococcus intermedius group]EHL7207217.1 class III lanthipeptide [Staphylococcus pseudintermedius]EHP0459697.1 class III lanthipeptide [Staphylococcus pseudintermedius]EHP0513230.1 class III lanthipeptide [Staphylococcus pseudintermedius]EHS7171495.1 class III lanthipeptide [Staphylococcus pseudintermedius]EHS7221947.1 class III lanthipeptide [Staphylococcus pseudintermedius]